MCKPRTIFLMLSIMLCLVNRGFTATLLGSIPITGNEQLSNGAWDSGTVTATLNGRSVSFHYSQFSTKEGIASALGALISNSCNMPVYAKANGAVLNLYSKGTNVLTSTIIKSVSDNPSLFPNSSFSINGGVTWSPPQIDYLSMTEGPVGMGFIIYGSNFGSAKGSVMIGNIAATILSWSPDGTQIIVQVPNGLASNSIYGVVVETSTWWAFNTGTTTFQVDGPFGCN